MFVKGTKENVCIEALYMDEPTCLYRPENTSIRYAFSLQKRSFIP
jgi:hypothetical protein